MRVTPFPFAILALALAPAAAASGCHGSSGAGGGGGTSGGRDGGTTYEDGGIAQTPACKKGSGTAPVAAPKFVMERADRHGLVLVAGDRRPVRRQRRRRGRSSCRATRSTSSTPTGKTLSHVAAGARPDRIYAPAPIGDFDGDGATDLAVGSSNGTVAMYTWTTSAASSSRSGWAGASTRQRRRHARDARHGGGRPRRRRDRRDGLHDDEHLDDRRAGLRLRARRHALPARERARASRRGRATTRRRARATTPTSTARATPATAATGENVGIGQLDDTPELEIAVTYDDHQLNVFHHDGTSALASPLVHEPGRTCT